MINQKQHKFEPEILSLKLDHNPYECKIYSPKKKCLGTILFPIFHYQGSNQYIDLIEPIVEKGYRVIGINFLNKGDKVLTFEYYYSLFVDFYNDFLLKKNLVDDGKVILMGVGVSANLVSYMNLTNLKFAKMILISPVNNYKAEYSISREVSNFKIPTYIFYGEFDKENAIDNRFSIYSKGKDNKNVVFSSYPCTGLHLYYEPLVSMELERMYRRNGIDVLVGEDRKSSPTFLPNEARLNEQFFNHLFLALQGKPLPIRILLITETFPNYTVGKGTSIEFLRKELSKLGYETYITGLWKKYDDFANLPNYCIPIPCTNEKIINKDERYKLLSGFSVTKATKLLATFGFTYLHLYSNYQMGKVGLELSKVTGIKMPYTYHTLWSLYYSKKINQLIKDSSKKFAKKFIKSKVYKDSPLIITQSKKSYSIFCDKMGVTKDIRINTTPMNSDIFYFNKSDFYNVEILRKEHQLKGKKIIGYVNKVSPEENTFELISYFARLNNEMPNVVLMIIGAGAATETLKKFTRKLGVQDKVIFVNEVNNEERKWYMHLFDAFVSGSDFELQGSPYFEAAFSGTVIISKRNEASAGLLLDSVNAYVYNDFEQFSERLEKALYGDNKKIIACAKELAKKNSPEKWAKFMLKTYQELNNSKL